MPLKSYGTSVKAMGYGGLCRTNSVDMKNIAYREQFDCHFDHALPAGKSCKSWLTWWKHAHKRASARDSLIQSEQDQTAS
jgi:hypothetical protein